MNQYDTLFSKIIDKETPDPTIIINNEAHMPRVRAGLNRAKKAHDSMLKLMGEDTLDSQQFKYTHDKLDPSKVTISLKIVEATSFEILP